MLKGSEVLVKTTQNSKLPRRVKRYGLPTYAKKGKSEVKSRRREGADDYVKKSGSLVTPIKPALTRQPNWNKK